MQGRMIENVSPLHCTCQSGMVVILWFHREKFQHPGCMWRLVLSIFKWWREARHPLYRLPSSLPSLLLSSLVCPMGPLQPASDGTTGKEERSLLIFCSTNWAWNCQCAISRQDAGGIELGAILHLYQKANGKEDSIRIGTGVLLSPMSCVVGLWIEGPVCAQNRPL